MDQDPGGHERQITACEVLLALAEQSSSAHRLITALLRRVFRGFFMAYCRGTSSEPPPSCSRRETHGGGRRCKSAKISRARGVFARRPALNTGCMRCANWSSVMTPAWRSFTARLNSVQAIAAVRSSAPRRSGLTEAWSEFPTNDRMTKPIKTITRMTTARSPSFSSFRDSLALMLFPCLAEQVGHTDTPSALATLPSVPVDPLLRPGQPPSRPAAPGSGSIEAITRS